MTRRMTITTFGSLSGLFTLAFAGALVVLALLGNFGLPDTVLGTTLGVGVVVAFAIAGVSARTMRPEEFHAAGGSLSAVANGIATAAAFLGGCGAWPGLCRLLGLSRGYRHHAGLVTGLPAACPAHLPLCAQIQRVRRCRLPRRPLRQSRRSRRCGRDRRSNAGPGPCSGARDRNATHHPRLFALSSHVRRRLSCSWFFPGRCSAECGR